MVNPLDAMEKVDSYSINKYRQTIKLATKYTLTGPTSGVNGVASTPFTVSLPANTVTLPVTITPHDSGTGNAGVFSPASMILKSDNPTETFTYTPGSTGVKVISVTNVVDNGNIPSITNPSDINYTSS